MDQSVPSEKAKPTASRSSNVLFRGIRPTHDAVIGAFIWHEPYAICVLHDPISELRRGCPLSHGFPCCFTCEVLPLFFWESLAPRHLMEGWVVVFMISHFFIRRQYNQPWTGKRSLLRKLHRDIPLAKNVHVQEQSETDLMHDLLAAPICWKKLEFH